jgi:outer membrane protein OmpA-like peptidoglycan-associated protein
MSARAFVLATMAAAVAACSALPERNNALEAARAGVNSAQLNPQIITLAPDELKRATESLGLADKAWADGAPTSTVDHLAYMSSQRVVIAQDTASSRASQALTAGAAAERDKLRLEMRTREADAAQRELASAQQSNAQKTSELALADATALREQARSDARVSDLESQMKELNAKRTDRGIVVILGDVLFDSGQSRVRPGGAQSMVKLADFFKANPQRTASIEGYTDNVGSASANYGLSERRAAAVKTALVNLGVPADRLSARAYGAENPAADNATAAGRQMNRRVEIVFGAQGNEERSSK